MQVITKAEFKDWLENQKIVDSAVDYIDSTNYHFKQSYRIPNDSGRKSALANCIVRLFTSASEICMFVHEYGVFPSCEIRDLFDGYRNHLGEERTLEEAPGHIFSKDELREFVSLLSCVLYFSWGCHIISQDNGVYLKVSHDEYFDVMTNERKNCEAIKSVLKQHKIDVIS